MHKCMCYMFFFLNNNLTNCLYFYNKNFVNFKCIHAFAWSYMLVINNRRFSGVNGKPTRVLSINNTFLMEKVYL